MPFQSDRAPAHIPPRGIVSSASRQRRSRPLSSAPLSARFADIHFKPSRTRPGAYKFTVSQPGTTETTTDPYRPLRSGTASDRDKIDHDSDVMTTAADFATLVLGRAARQNRESRKAQSAIGSSQADSNSTPQLDAYSAIQAPLTEAATDFAKQFGLLVNTSGVPDGLKRGDPFTISLGRPFHSTKGLPDCFEVILRYEDGAERYDFTVTTSDGWPLSRDIKGRAMNDVWRYGDTTIKKLTAWREYCEELSVERDALLCAEAITKFSNKDTSAWGRTDDIRLDPIPAEAIRDEFCNRDRDGISEQGVYLELMRRYAHRVRSFRARDPSIWTRTGVRRACAEARKWATTRLKSLEQISAPEGLDAGPTQFSIKVIVRNEDGYRERYRDDAELRDGSNNV